MIKMLKRSPHYGQHVAHGAKGFMDFAGWEMPEYFSSPEEEARAFGEVWRVCVVLAGNGVGDNGIKPRRPGGVLLGAPQLPLVSLPEGVGHVWDSVKVSPPKCWS